MSPSSVKASITGNIGALTLKPSHAYITCTSLDGQPMDHADCREETTSREHWLPPYTQGERRRELSMRSRLLRWRAQQALYRGEALRERMIQLHIAYLRLVFLLRGVGKRLES
jgi:hypothetical protein